MLSRKYIIQDAMRVLLISPLLHRESLVQIVYKILPDEDAFPPGFTDSDIKEPSTGVLQTEFRNQGMEDILVYTGEKEEEVFVSIKYVVITIVSFLIVRVLNFTKNKNQSSLEKKIRVYNEGNHSFSRH